MERRTIYYSGHVQGVGFRYTVRRIARSFPVTGYVRNLVDGRVELVAEGEPGELNRFVDAIGQTMSHYIQRIHADTAVASGEFDGFEIRF